MKQVHSKKIINPISFFDSIFAPFKVGYPVPARILQFWEKTGGNLFVAHLRAASSWTSQATYVLTKTVWSGHQAQALG
jgi:hypothetical protein